MSSNGDGAAADAQSAAPFHLIEKVVCGIAATILFCLMVCTFFDVVGRYVFNSPVPGALELTEIMMASLIFTILPIVSARSDHITVDLLVLPRSSMLRQIQNIAINVTSAIMLAVLAWQLWLHAADMYSYNAISPFLSIPMAPVTTLMAAMTGTTSAILLCLALRPLLPSWLSSAGS